MDGGLTIRRPYHTDFLYEKTEMKRNKILFAFICSFMFFAVLGGCNNVSENGETGNVEEKFIPDDIVDKKLSDLPVEQQKEIEKLYGCYWMNGIKDNCVEIGDGRFAVYSTAMSFGYVNFRWAKVSDMWVCCSYHKTDFDYTPKDRKVILKFVKDGDGNFRLWQYAIPMNNKSGPFIKGKNVEEIEKDGVKFYVYDRTDPTSPKMKAPTEL